VETALSGFFGSKLAISFVRSEVSPGHGWKPKSGRVKGRGRQDYGQDHREHLKLPSWAQVLEKSLWKPTLVHWVLSVFTGSVNRRPWTRVSKMTPVLDTRVHGPGAQVVCTDL